MYITQYFHKTGSHYYYNKNNDSAFVPLNLVWNLLLHCHLADIQSTCFAYT